MFLLKIKLVQPTGPIKFNLICVLILMLYECAIELVRLQLYYNEPKTINSQMSMSIALYIDSTLPLHPEFSLVTLLELKNIIINNNY